MAIKYLFSTSNFEIRLTTCPAHPGQIWKTDSLPWKIFTNAMDNLESVYLETWCTYILMPSYYFSIAIFLSYVVGESLIPPQMTKEKQKSTLKLKQCYPCLVNFITVWLQIVYPFRKLKYYSMKPKYVFWLHQFNNPFFQQSFKGGNKVHLMHMMSQG